MKLRHLFLVCLLLVAAAASSKQVKITVNILAPQHRDSVYLVVNEDVAHYIALPIENGEVHATLKLEKGAFVRANWELSERIYVQTIFIVDGKSVDINLRRASVKGSPLNNRFFQHVHTIDSVVNSRLYIDPPHSNDPQRQKEIMENFHAATQAEAQRIQIETSRMLDIIFMNEKDNIIPAWFVFQYYDARQKVPYYANTKKPQPWMKHNILQQKAEELAIIMKNALGNK